jgi:hypothetical protein
MVDVGFGVASSIAMDAEHRLRQRISVLSGDGTDERITVTLSSTKAGAKGSIDDGTRLLEERSLNLVGVHEPDAGSRDRPDLVITQIIVVSWSRCEDRTLTSQHCGYRRRRSRRYLI